MIHAQSPIMPSLGGLGQKDHEFENSQTKQEKKRQGWGFGWLGI